MTPSHSPSHSPSHPPSHSQSPYDTPAGRQALPHLERCPRLVPVCGHPVYVAPEFDGNCFYLEGAYWVLTADAIWWRSAAFDGPWQPVDGDHVPPALWRLPRSAYRALPAWLGEGLPHRPPRWDLVWGADWAHRHPGWARHPGPLHPRDAAGARPPAQQAQELLRAPPRRPAEAGFDGVDLHD